MSIRRSFVVSALCAVVVCAGSGCTTDVKGESCGVLDAFYDGDDAYCPDEDAPDDCEDVIDALVDAFAGCGVDEDQARDAAEDALDCDTAVATTNDFDDCLDTLQETECLLAEDGLPDDCKGAVLTHE